MYCAKCGTLGRAGETVCVKCASPLTEHPYQTAPATVSAPRPPPATVPYAGFWVRTAAHVVDYIIVMIAVFVLAVACVAMLGPKGRDIAALSVYVLGPWLYYALFESSPLQGTPGKLALGLRVTNEAGDRLGFGAATGRFWGQIISQLTLGIGYAMVAFTERRQALHDKMAGALVVQRSFPVHEIGLAGPAPTVSAAIPILAIAGILFAGIWFTGILAAIAVPAYQDYSVRAQVAEGLNAAAAYKAAVAEALAQGQDFSSLTTQSLKVSSPSTLKYVEGIDIVNGAIEIRYGGSAARAIAGQSLVLVPMVTENQDVVWVCGHHPPPPGVTAPADYGEQRTSIQPKYLPVICRP